MLPTLVFLLFIVSIQAIQPYNDVLARRLVLYAAASYADDPSACLLKVNRNFTGYKEFHATMQYNQTAHSFVGLDPVQKQIVISFRGTDNSFELLEEILSALWGMAWPDLGSVQVLAYFAEVADMLIKEAIPHITHTYKMYPDYQVVVTGHSLGGSLASIVAATLVNRNIVPGHAIQVYTFGEPRTGDYAYAKLFNQIIPSNYRIVHNSDLIPHSPPCHFNFFGHCISGIIFYAPYHSGVEVWYPSWLNRQDGVMGSYKLCGGQPFGEDARCSNSLEEFRVDEHLTYFGIDMGNWCMQS